MSDHGKQGWTSTVKSNPWKTNFLIVNMTVCCNRISGIASGGGRTSSSMEAILKLVAVIAVVVIGVQTVRVSGEVCPHVTITCPLTTLESGETVQFIPKLMQPGQEVLISGLPAILVIPDSVRRYYCTEPACRSNPCLHGGTCKETDAGFTCLCLDGYRGERCAEDVTIYSLKLLGEKINEGTLSLAFRSSPNTYVLVHQDHWNRNLSQLACQYLGFEGVLATLSSSLYESSSVDAPAEAESVICPPNATNITDCWYSETRVGRINESEIISIVCCSVNPCNISGQPLGLESGALPDSALSSSSCMSPLYCSRFGRLNSDKGWLALNTDPNPWIQVHFESSYIVTAITTQGITNSIKRLTSYTFSSSLDDMTWTDYLNVYSGSDSVKRFPGNYDSESHVTHTLARPVVGRSFRIYQTVSKNYGFIALRMELYGYGPLTDVIASLNLDAEFGCNPPVLGEGLGVEDGRIPDSSLTSSSVYQTGYEAYRGRLNNVTGTWVASNNDNNIWFKVDLGEDTSVTGVITQGLPKYRSRVTSFQISFSRDDTNWTFALEEHCGVRKTYAGNFDSDTHVTILFPEPVTARYVMFHPVTTDGPAALRVEVLGIKT
ncbi:EGF-like repeat and discoidin I-like domain-containing protein 3 isoform X2 [Strongylocentrotus purpuratus]|uniref:Uncharacterized protein n=1 Tax=Strongylocentrotus purpuratus TaxID=7668 RepID=A0A7M7NM88_STRPU|nr:EGF-like repeat and discoidin I-like domain-containing protein 3 isoform X2 [Strongylocentrotus purpuratus]